MKFSRSDYFERWVEILRATLMSLLVLLLKGLIPFCSSLHATKKWASIKDVTFSGVLVACVSSIAYSRLQQIEGVLCFLSCNSAAKS